MTKQLTGLQLDLANPDGTAIVSEKRRNRRIHTERLL
ncbi:MAG: hypothetical protein K0R08_2019 [Solimicrobium sp.]|jgi:hypothetical protein|nr:hypothetical protein [Solimicrobium sp.]